MCMGALALLSAAGASPARADERAVARTPVPRAAAQARALTPAQSAYIERSLTAQQRAQLTSMAQTLARTPSYDAIDDQWTRFLQTWPADKPMDVDAVIARVLHESHLASRQALAEYSDRLRYFNEQKSRLRRDLQSARSRQAAARATGVQAEQASAEEIRQLESRLARAERDARSAQLQLQQKQQHENRQFTMIANVMKVKHDTAKASISNVR